jgi:hypothetical protein
MSCVALLCCVAVCHRTHCNALYRMLMLISTRPLLTLLIPRLPWSCSSLYHFESRIPTDCCYLLCISFPFRFHPSHSVSQLYSTKNMWHQTRLPTNPHYCSTHARPRHAMLPQGIISYVCSERRPHMPFPSRKMCVAGRASTKRLGLSWLKKISCKTPSLCM